MGKYSGTVALADIKCYRDKERTDLVAEFKGFPEVREFLNVKSVKLESLVEVIIGE